jgi:hypothetical protein
MRLDLARYRLEARSAMLQTLRAGGRGRGEGHPRPGQPVRDNPLALIDRIADHLERLDRDATLAPEQRAAVDAALELVLIAGEELAAYGARCRGAPASRRHRDINPRICVA